ncbi:MAG TPA: DUF998 domain-containing protein [Ktedonobacterales bacterium]|nr:DUF998 domain-containing protein [Ktedonobacterales bacterium]
MTSQTTTSARPRTTTAFLRYGLLAGIVGPVLFVIVLLIEGATRPGYSAWRHFGSQLSLSNQGWEQITNFIVCGLLCFWFAFGLRRMLVTGKGAIAAPVALGIFGLALVVAGIFVTGPSLGYPPGAGAGKPFRSESLHAIVHGLAGLTCFASLAVACFVMARRFGGDPRWRGWAIYSTITGAVVALSFIVSTTTGTLDQQGIWPNAPTGLFQRVGIVVGWTWIAFLAARLLRAPSLAHEASVDAGEKPERAR